MSKCNSGCSCTGCPTVTAVMGGSSGRREGRRLRLPLAAWFFIVVATGVLVLDLLDANAEVYHSRESALRLAFPDADSVTTRTLTLSEDEAQEVSDRSGRRPDSRLVQVYEAWAGGTIRARGIIDTHNVRSLPETIFVVVGVDHRVKAVHLLAFHEPVQYRASSRWLEQFEDETLDRDLVVRRDIAGIAGATMTANVITAAVRRCVATIEVGCAPPPGQYSEGAAP